MRRGSVGSRRADGARGLHSCGAAGERHQRDVARALDGYAEPALMARADAGHAAGQNLAALLHELRKNVGALVVDEVHLLDAKLADLLFAEVLALAAARAAWSAGAAAWTSFAAWTAVPAAGASVTGASVSAAWAAFAAHRGTAFTSASGSALGAACASARSAGSLRFLFVCHTCLPFNYEPEVAGSLKIVSFRG
jgi:hypothetical protein